MRKLYSTYIPATFIAYRLVETPSNYTACATTSFVGNIALLPLASVCRESKSHLTPWISAMRSAARRRVI